MAARIERLQTAGTFSLDGGTWEVENNVWIVGDDSEVIVIDPAHSSSEVARAVGGRRVKAILLTHGHDDHVRAALDAKAALGDPPVLLNHADLMLWEMVHPGTAPDGDIADGDEFPVAGVTLRAVHTPGHSPGSTCFILSGAAEGPVVFTGDTLFNGGPGATGRSYSSFETIIESIRDRLLSLPEETTVLTGHGDSTSIAAESGHLDEWIARGH
ncbi:MBL fold metallo-hydrolase [Brevibacterium sp. 50QC2O2]|uniref:MBL fold metallo-hydrolase n=1 Tax=Brevibacterium TaxID=1696 RepID=UPI00211CE63A|nr:MULTISPECIES: MBL fold metallo-hydrolase [unclassified Brevibacterium]MCQ9368945.1 MBL fold metallo-hydrolase [Brevibacterium sp. 91QC2O2]MCQ9385980.1 MBL fold metallo-hydrolase [Brevibacterium sp. 68QC2CO]MCQ9387729.1 MBL fold metallo-hydrolase [Brevibacterium sp. 50QC2O2]